MSILDIFKHDEPPVSGEMMNEDQFWALIEAANHEAADLEELTVILTKKLAQLSDTEIIGFDLREQKLRFDSYTSDLWCAAFIMNDGCSDDDFEYFRSWVMAQGREVFYDALNNPDSLSAVYNPEIESYEYEDLVVVATNAFEDKNGCDMVDFMDTDRFETDETHYPELTFNWEEEDPESIKAICPKLFELAKKH